MSWETPTGSITGITPPVLTAAGAIWHEIVVVDHMPQVRGVDYTLTPGLTQITFLWVLPANALVSLYREGAQNLDRVDFETPTGTIDGTHPPVLHCTTAILDELVFVGDTTSASAGLGAGALAYQPGVDYRVTGSQIAFLIVLPTTAIVRVSHSKTVQQRFLSIAPSDAFDGHSNPTLTLPVPPANAWVNIERFLFAPVVDYTIAGVQISLLFAPDADAVAMSALVTPDGLAPRDWTITTPGTGLAAPAYPNAFPSSWRTVRFDLGFVPDFAVSPNGVGDALNPASWLVQNKGGAALTVLQIARVDETTFDVTVQEQMPSHLQPLTVGSTGLLFLGQLFGFTFTVQGMYWKEVFTQEGASSRKRRVNADLDNKPTPLPQSSLIGGTLTIRGGDYATVHGKALVEKLQMRRLTTRTGGFFHLPGYGLGVLRPKEPLPITDVLKEKAEIERQCQLEPEVAKSVAQITIDGGGILRLSVSSQLHQSVERANITINRQGT